jgi:hypothetical protein
MFGCRVLKPTNPIERDLDVELVQTVLTTEYHDPNVKDLNLNIWSFGV